MTAKSSARSAKPKTPAPAPIRAGTVTGAAKSGAAARAGAAKGAAKSGAAKSAVAGAAKSGAAGKSAVAAKSVTTPKSGAAALTKSAAGGKSSVGKSAAERDPRHVVRPLVRVRQMREFTSRRVTRAELEAITEVARWSGSSRNEQPCRFIAIRDQEMIQRVAALGLPQTRGLPTATAAVAIVVPNEAERELSRAFDDGRAAERILIAANLLGLGGGIARVRQDVRESIDQALGLPANRSVRTIVGLGHPTADALAPKSKPGHARLPREEVVYEERWPERPRIGYPGVGEASGRESVGGAANGPQSGAAGE